jgi:hypothetical protein
LLHRNNSPFGLAATAKQQKTLQQREPLQGFIDLVVIGGFEPPTSAL